MSDIIDFDHESLVALREARRRVQSLARDQGEVMRGEVTDIDDHRPHLVLTTAAASNVIPVALAEEWARGTKPLPDDEILRRIILEWLCFIGAVPEDHHNDDPAA